VTVRWKKSEEGYVESHCGHWKITPEYWSCVNPQAYTLWRDNKKVSYGCSTQRDAKQSADNIVNRETQDAFLAKTKAVRVTLVPKTKKDQ
jgi:hypothetical protein